jgi:hypothetical protein
MDANRGLNKENQVVFTTLFLCLNPSFKHRLDSVYGIKKPEPNDSGFLCREEYPIIEP